MGFLRRTSFFVAPFWINYVVTGFNFALAMMIIFTILTPSSQTPIDPLFRRPAHPFFVVLHTLSSSSCTPFLRRPAHPFFVVLHTLSSSSRTPFLRRPAHPFFVVPHLMRDPVTPYRANGLYPGELSPRPRIKPVLDPDPASSAGRRKRKHTSKSAFCNGP